MKLTTHRKETIDKKLEEYKEWNCLLYTSLKRLMNSNEVDTIINACDAGREGEAIFRLVYMLSLIHI